MGEFTSAEHALDELCGVTSSDPYDDTEDALRDHLHEARDRVISELTSLRAENARLRAALLRLADDDSDEAYAARAALDAKEGE